MSATPGRRDAWGKSFFKGFFPGVAAPRRLRSSASMSATPGRRGESFSRDCSRRGARRLRSSASMSATPGRRDAGRIIFKGFFPGVAAPRHLRSSALLLSTPGRRGKSFSRVFPGVAAPRRLRSSASMSATPGRRDAERNRFQGVLPRRRGASAFTFWRFDVRNAVTPGEIVFQGVCSRRRGASALSLSSSWLLERFRKQRIARVRRVEVTHRRVGDVVAVQGILHQVDVAARRGDRGRRNPQFPADGQDQFLTPVAEDVRDGDDAPFQRVYGVGSLYFCSTVVVPR